ncbi:MAG: ABC transporter ATP-binding protein [Patescibacteria group bacterium]|jgi:hypothetical protein
MTEKQPIYHLSFPNQYLLTATFLRFQEHHESPKFRGRIFDWEEYMDWYAGQKGNFSYLQDWSGFNIPSTVFAPFLAGAFDPLTRKEAALIESVRGLPEPFYVIATIQGNSRAMAHEIIHGLYFVRPDYRQAVEACLAGQDTLRLRGCLGQLGYHEAVFNDEINAYVLTGLEASMRGPDVRRLKRALRRVFADHFGFDPGTKAGASRLAASIHHFRSAIGA